jgi:hypothetical protein
MINLAKTHLPLASSWHPAHGPVRLHFELSSIQPAALATDGSKARRHRIGPPLLLGIAFPLECLVIPEHLRIQLLRRHAMVKIQQTLQDACVVHEVGGRYSNATGKDAT